MKEFSKALVALLSKALVALLWIAAWLAADVATSYVCGDYPDSTSYPDEDAPMTEVWR